MNILKYFWPMLGSNGLGFSPDLNNLEFWQGSNLYDDNETDNKVSGGVNADITESNCLSFNGTDNYIDTGLYGSDSTILVIKGKFNVANKQQILLSDDNVNNRKFFFGVVATNVWRVGYGDNSNTAGGASDTDYHTFIFSGGKLWIENFDTSTDLSNINYIIANNTPEVTSTGTWGGGNSIISFMLGALKLSTGNASNYADFTQTEVKVWIDGINLTLEATNGEGSGAIVYDKSGNDNHLSVAGTLTNIWATSNDQRPYNLENGFDRWNLTADNSKLYVPFDVNGVSIKTDGDAITGYTWDSINPSGSKLWNFSENKFAIIRSANVVVNGGFDADTDWTKQGTWIISGGTASCINANANNYIYQLSALDIGETYKITYTIISLTSGLVGYIAGSFVGEAMTTPGTYTEYITANGEQIGIGARVSNTSAVIDNVIAKKILHEDCQGILDHADYGTKLFSTAITAGGTNVALKNTLDYSVAP